MPAFNVSVARPLDLASFSDRLAFACLFGFGAAGYFIGDWAEGVQAGLAAYLTWSLSRELDPDHPLSANLAALGGGGLGLLMDTHAGVLFVILLAVKVMVGSSGLAPPPWEAAVLGLGAVIFSGTETGWWAGGAMAAALYLDTCTEPRAPRANRWIAGGVAVAASIFYFLLGQPDSQWWVYLSAVAMGGVILAFGRRVPRGHAAVVMFAVAPTLAAGLLGEDWQDGLGGGSPEALVVFGAGLVCSLVLAIVRPRVRSPADEGGRKISSVRVAAARRLVVAFLIVSWVSAAAGSITDAVEPVAPLWGAMVMVGARVLLHRAGWRARGFQP